MKKKIKIIGILIIIFLISLTTASAVENVNQLEAMEEIKSSSDTKIYRFSFCKITSSGYGKGGISKPSVTWPIYVHYYDENATTTIKFLFGLFTYTIQGNHRLIIFPLFKFGNIDVPDDEYGNVSINCRAYVAVVQFCR